MIGTLNNSLKTNYVLVYFTIDTKKLEDLIPSVFILKL